MFLKFAFGAIAASGFAVTATPALASSASSADIAAPLRAAEASKTTADTGDEEFRRLFSSWQALDSHSIQSPVTRSGSVSIPSLMPVSGVHLTSGYGMRWHPVLGGRRQHKGVDLATPVGTPIHASADGVVGKADWFGGYGLYVQIEHGGNLETRYGHMSRIAVAEGEHVHKGEVIGYVGTTGRSTGPHLHYEVRVNGEAVNPIPYMQGGETKLLASNDPAEGRGGPD
ncbi:M23 family metallopeptidase [Novosphingobium lentum]|uniref:M23 family metallopeptidase n=1 Tax=Novosphingobium lentum TaxID=145287 RepID=UPI001FDFC6F7|nr:M23 family metallopeptidase [Novosphingobium lentum]